MENSSGSQVTTRLTAVVMAGFLNTRATIQRLRDARILHGWVESFDEDELSVRTLSETLLTDGEEFFFQINGLEVDAKFKGKLIAQLKAGPMDGSEQGTLCLFTILGQKKTSVPKTDARLANQGMSAIFVLDGHEITVDPVELKDVSMRGLSAVIPVSVPVGTPLIAKAATMSGEVIINVEVRNCRELKGGEGFRVGCLIRSMHRIDELRWKALFKHAA